jgi:hypothetical protein
LPDAALGRGSADAVIETADGKLSIGDTWGDGAMVIDEDGKPVAKARTSGVVLSNDETLSWKMSALPRNRYRLGDDLWLATPGLFSRSKFTAELSEAMLARIDRALLVGIATILTYYAIADWGRMKSAAAGGIGP